MAAELTEGETYTVRATITNLSTKAGAPVAAVLTVNIAGVVDSQTILDDSAVYGFAASEVHAFDFTLSVPIGTGGKTGAIVAEVLDPNGNKLADGSLDVIIAPVGLLLNPGFEDGILSPWAAWINAAGGGRCKVGISDEAAYEGLYSARFTASTGLTRSIIATLTQTIDWRDEYRGKAVIFGAKAKGIPKNNMSIQIADGVGVSSSPVHSGSNQWQELLVPRVIAANANKLEVVLKFAPDKSLGTKAKAYFDATFLEGI